MKLSRLTVSAIALGAAVTMGAAGIGLANLERHYQNERASRDSQFFEEVRFDASLRDSQIFSAPRVGYAGSPPAIASEFTMLMAEPKAEEKLLALLSQSASGGTLHGLCGLEILGSKSFEPALSSISRHDSRRVVLARGCTTSASTTREVVQGSEFENICREWRALLRR